MNNTDSRWFAALTAILELQIVRALVLTVSVEVDRKLAR